MKLIHLMIYVGNYIDTGSLPGGAIAGIVIGCLVFIIVIIFISIRFLKYCKLLSRGHNTDGTLIRDHGLNFSEKRK